MDERAVIKSNINKMKIIYESFLQFVDKPQFEGNELKKLIVNLSQNHFFENKNDLKSFLHLVSKISKNHNRSFDLIFKIEQIIQNIKDQILNFFSNFEIFNIFKTNKRILLYLFNEKILIPDYQIYYIIKSEEFANRLYLEYFKPEFKSFIEKESQESKSTSEKIDTIENKIDQESFERKRRIGENDNYICELIRNDSIDEFIRYVEINNLDISKATIEPSIFETNARLFKKIDFLRSNDEKRSLIEYAAFYGSIQIFKYIMIKTTIYFKEELLIFAVHGNNAEIIHMLEDFKCKSFIKIISQRLIYKEANKCHHNELATYFENNFSIKPEYVLAYSLKFYNFAFVESENISYEYMLNLCAYDYIEIVEAILKNEEIDVNKSCILYCLFN